MKSALYHGYDTNKDIVEECDDINSFLDSIKYCIGDKVLLVGDVRNLGKRLRMCGAYVTILEHNDYQDVCLSLVHNENCTVVKGSLEYMPFNDNFFDKVIVLDHFNHTSNCKKASMEIRRVLKNKGELLLEDRNIKNLRVKLRYLKRRLLGETISYNYPHEVFKLFSNLDFDGNLKEIEDERYIYIGKVK